MSPFITVVNKKKMFRGAGNDICQDIQYFGMWEYLKDFTDNRPLKLNMVQTGKIKIAGILKMSWWHCVPAR